MKNKTPAITEENTTSAASAIVGGKVVIDVRFNPNGLVNAINHRPANMGAQDCPSSDEMGQADLFRNGGSGSSGTCYAACA